MLEQVQSEGERLKIDVMGVAVVRWRDTGVYRINGWSFYNSGGTEHHQGVGFLVAPNMERAITAVQPSE